MQIPHKILYIEKKPLKREIIFNNRAEYVLFFNDYYKEILDYCWKDDLNRINPQEYYDYQTHNLNKDGSISKKHDASQLLTSQAKKKQQKNWKKYLEKRKLQTIESAYRRKKAEIEFKIEYWKKQLNELEKEKQ